MSVWGYDRQTLLAESKSAVVKKLSWGDEYLRPLMGRPPDVNDRGEPYCGRCDWPAGVNSTIVRWIIDVEDERLAIDWEDAFDRTMEEERSKLADERRDANDDGDDDDNDDGDDEDDDVGIYFRSHGSYARTRDDSIAADSKLLAAG